MYVINQRLASLESDFQDFKGWAGTMQEELEKVNKIVLPQAEKKS